MRLDQEFYDGIVIGVVEGDVNGGVYAEIAGITDGLDNVEDFPIVLPSVTTMQQVPEVGYLLKVRFYEGDIHQGKYIAMSSSKRHQPEIFNNKNLYGDYGDLSYSNLGDDRFNMIHNRKTTKSIISHPSNSQLIWEPSGEVLHPSDNAHPKVGLDAKTSDVENGLLPVLTEGTIDVFCCTAIGSGRTGSDVGARQGSDYLSVSHMSKETYEKVKNYTPPLEIDEESDVSDVVQRTLSDGKSIVNVNGISDSITPQAMRKIESIVIIGLANDISSNVRMMTDKSSTFSVHYIVGDEYDAFSSGNSKTNMIQILGDSSIPMMFPGVTLNSKIISHNSIIIGVCGRVDSQKVDSIRSIVNDIKSRMSIKQVVTRVSDLSGVNVNKLINVNGSLPRL